MLILHIEPDQLAETMYEAFVKAVKETNPHPGLINWKRLVPAGRRQWISMASHIIDEHAATGT